MNLKLFYNSFPFVTLLLTFLFFDIFTLLCPACTSSWEQRLSSKVPFFLWYDSLSTLPSFRGHQVLCLLIVFGWSLTFWVASSVRPTKQLLLNSYFLNDGPLSVIVIWHSRTSLEDEVDCLFCDIQLSSTIKTCLPANQSHFLCLTATFSLIHFPYSLHINFKLWNGYDFLRLSSRPNWQFFLRRNLPLWSFFVIKHSSLTIKNSIAHKTQDSGYLLSNF